MNLECLRMDPGKLEFNNQLTNADLLENYNATIAFVLSINILYILDRRGRPCGASHMNAKGTVCILLLCLFAFRRVCIILGYPRLVSYPLKCCIISYIFYAHVYWSWISGLVIV